MLLRFSSNPSNLFGKVFLCGRIWPQVHLNLNSIWIHESDFKGFFLEKRPWKSFPIKCSNSGINESTPQTQSNIIWIWSKTKLEISLLNSLSEKWVWESGLKIDPATGVSLATGVTHTFWSVPRQQIQNSVPRQKIKKSFWFFGVEQIN